jgi:serine O-acetyltransferase
MATLKINNVLLRLIRNYVQNYNHEKYWKRRCIFIDLKKKTNRLIKTYYLYYIKKKDAFHNCSFGTYFVTPPFLHHGPNGITVGYDLKIGNNAIIYHQGTLANGGNTRGGNVSFGAGNKLLEGINVCNNV